MSDIWEGEVNLNEDDLECMLSEIGDSAIDDNDDFEDYLKEVRAENAADEFVGSDAPQAAAEDAMAIEGQGQGL